MCWLSVHTCKKLLQKFTSANARIFRNMHAVIRLNMPITLALYFMQNCYTTLWSSANKWNPSLLQVKCTPRLFFYLICARKQGRPGCLLHNLQEDITVKSVLSASVMKAQCSFPLPLQSSRSPAWAQFPSNLLLPWDEKTSCSQSVCAVDNYQEVHTAK